MNEFVPRGYLTLKKALEHFGKLKHADKWEAEKASSKREFQQLLFDETVPAKHFIGGKLRSLESSIWGRGEAEYIFASGWATIHGGNVYFPATVHGPVLIKQSSIDALFDGDSDDSSQSPEAKSDGTLTAEAPETRKEKRVRGTKEKPQPPPKKRRGGPKRGPYFGPLLTHLKWRKDNRNDLHTASLTELREDALSRLRTDKVKGIPKSRSALDDAIKKAVKELDQEALKELDATR